MWKTPNTDFTLISGYFNRGLRHGRSPIFLREFVLNSRHLGPRRVWKCGSEPRSEPHFRKLAEKNVKTNVLGNPFCIMQNVSMLLKGLLKGIPGPKQIQKKS